MGILFSIFILHESRLPPTDGFGGYNIRIHLSFLLHAPFPPSSLSLFRDPSHKPLLKQEVQFLLCLGAMEPVPTQHKRRGLCSKDDLVTKKERQMATDFRSTDAEYLCQGIEIKDGDTQPSFRLWTRGLLCDLDCEEMYFRIAIHPSHKKCLHFMVRQNHCQYHVLSFRVATAPGCLQKSWKMVAAQLHQWGVMVFPCLDNWLIKGRFYTDVKSAVFSGLRLFNSLGLQLSFMKSSLLPVQRIEFIGVILDPTTARTRLQMAGSSLCHFWWCTFWSVLKSLPDYACNILGIGQCVPLSCCMHICTSIACKPGSGQCIQPNRDSLNKLLSIPCHILVSIKWWKNLDKAYLGVPFNHHSHKSFLCVPPWTGSSSPGPHYPGQMDYPRGHTAYQCSGTRSCQICLCTLSTHDPKTIHPHNDRQEGKHVIYEFARGGREPLLSSQRSWDYGTGA